MPGSTYATDARALTRPKGVPHHRGLYKVIIISIIIIIIIMFITRTINTIIIIIMNVIITS